jgi:hypothetical protein
MLESRTISARPDVALANTSPRVTPTPPRASRFGEVLANTAVRSAESAMRALPGSPMMAIAIRGATASTMSSPQGPGASLAGAMGPAPSLAGPATAGATAPGIGNVPNGGTGGIEASLQQSQDLNLYYLQMQEAVSQQNREFTAISNVLKAKHDTVKTAIGNIR